MTRELQSIDISNSPDLLRLAREIQVSREGRVLRRNGEDVAILLPVRKPATKRSRKKSRESAYEAFRAAAGSWADVDIDQFLKDNARSRRISSRPRVEW